MIKKVCHITTVHGPEDIRIFIKECTSLAKLGFEVHLIAPTDKKYVKNGVTIHPLISKWENRALRMFERVQKAKTIALQIDADLYHFHDPELLRIAHTLKRGNKKVVYDAHEDTAKQIMSKYYIKPAFRKIISSSFSKYERYVTSRIDGVVTATPSILEQFKSLNIPSVNVNNFPVLKEFEDLSFNLSKKERAICYAGGLSEIRGIKEMIELAKLLPDVTVYLAGTFADGKAEELIKNAKSTKNLIFLGQLSRNDVKDLYSKCQIGMAILHPVPNHINSLPIKIFEYMSAGIPVIASDLDLWKSIIEPRNCGFCLDPFDVENVAKKVMFLLENPDKAKVMGDLAKKYVTQDFSWQGEEQKLGEFYQSLLA
jgi:glycosyltransferase involved in cell wall biosynthesis